MFDMSLKCYNEFDKIFTRFSKYVLGVHSKASNFGVYCELGQFPLIISFIASCINFWLHTVQSKIESLISEAYWEQLNNSGVKSLWLNFVKNVLEDLGVSHMWEYQSTFNASPLLTCIKNKLKEKFLSFQNKRLNSDDGMEKLRTYKLIIQKVELEPYLEILTDRKQRKALTAFRISAHKLQISVDDTLGEKGK